MRHRVAAALRLSVALVVNLKTAKALGITILLRGDEVIR
jgi:hypothetical protein